MMKTHYRFLTSSSDPIDISVDQCDDGLVRGVQTSQTPLDRGVMHLTHFQCRHCPLRASDSPYCPLARMVCPAVARFHDQDSYEPARVLVRTPARNYQKDTTVQGGLSSLLGLLMGGSGCPYMVFFRPMARFHLPFSTEEETVFRAISNVAVAGWLMRSEQKKVDEMQLVADIYRDIQAVNQGVSQRLKSMNQSDATNNAIVLLDLFAKSLGSYVDDGFEFIRSLYQPFSDVQVNNHAGELQHRAN